MNEDIFKTIAGMEKRAEEMVERAKQQARDMRGEVERKLAALADELEREHGMKRADIERELAKRREQIVRAFETKLRESLDKLDAAKSEKVAPAVEHVIKAFMDATHGH